VDTVHQRDVYHINAVCEVIQWEELPTRLDLVVG